jgi:hypothetical protein
MSLIWVYTQECRGGIDVGTRRQSVEPASTKVMSGWDL